jgi:hypothetical protein
MDPEEVARTCEKDKDLAPFVPLVRRFSIDGAAALTMDDERLESIARDADIDLELIKPLKEKMRVLREAAGMGGAGEDGDDEAKGGGRKRGGTF